MMTTGRYAVLLLSMLTGCASVAVTSDALEQRTALALGVERGQFTISDRVDDGVRTDYVAKTKSGKTYRCYVTGSFSVTGRAVSDALCTGTGAQAGHMPKGTQCNQLLKAAGKC